MKGKCKFIKDGYCTAYIDDNEGGKCIGYDICDAYEEEEWEKIILNS